MQAHLLASSSTLSTVTDLAGRAACLGIGALLSGLLVAVWFSTGRAACPAAPG